MLENIRKSTGDKVFDAVNLTLTTLLVLILFYPLWFVLCASFSNQELVFQNPLLLLPKGFTLKSYQTVFENKDIWVSLKNSVIITVTATALNLLMTVFAAYPLSRRDFIGRNVFTAILTFTMFFSGGMIPNYLVVDKLGMIDTLWALIIPPAVSFTNVIIVRTYFTQSIPYEMQEAAQIDGCGTFRMLTRIIIPLSVPILAVITLYYAVGHWNSYFNAMIYLYERSLYPLQLILREILLKDSLDTMLQVANSEMLFKQMMEKEGLKYAVVVISSIPFIATFPFFQKYFSKGVMIGAVKG